MTEFQEFPKWLYGPGDVSVVVDDAEQEAAQLAEWESVTDEQMQDAADRIVAERLAVVDVPPRRGRPPKAR